MESKYKIESDEVSFKIWAPDRPLVKVSLNTDETGFLLEDKRTREYIDAMHPRYETRLSYGYYNFRAMMKSIVSGLLQDWKPPEKHKHRAVIPPKLRNWVNDHCGKAIGKRIHAEWKRLVEKGNPIVRDVQRNVFASAGILSDVSLDAGFYKRADKYYLEDIRKYRAAALTTFPEIHDYQYDYNIGNDWKTYYTNPDFGVYTSLTKTLMNLPGGIPRHLLARLKYIRLERPFYSRRELLFLLACSTGGNLDYYPNTRCVSNNIKHIIQHATADEITRAAKDLDPTINLRKSSGIIIVADYLMDCIWDIEHNGNVVGLMEKAKRWHRQNRWRSHACEFPDNTPTAAPPIPLPEDKHIKLLGSVGEIIDESELMSHCVSTYASEAVKGRCFLFHIDYKNDYATAEITTTGLIRQISGKHNKRKGNAITYGKKVLGEWGQKFPNLVIDTKNGGVKYQAQNDEDLPF